MRALGASDMQWALLLMSCSVLPLLGARGELTPIPRGEILKATRMRRSYKPNPQWVFLALLTVQLLFGVNYVVSKVVVDTFSPLVWASARMIVSALFMLAIAILLRRPF